jgi:hypothetical protein
MRDFDEFRKHYAKLESAAAIEAYFGIDSTTSVNRLIDEQIRMLC